MLFEIMQKGSARKIRSQSAMEYLMTYGWSILIIAVVLGALYGLGVFNSANLGPRAPTGNCKVLRVAGTYNLEGTCSGELPQSVAQFNGQSSDISVGNGAGINVQNAITISAWIYSSETTIFPIFAKFSSGYSGYRFYETATGQLYFGYGNTLGTNVGSAISAPFMLSNTWYHVVASFIAFH